MAFRSSKSASAAPEAPAMSPVVVRGDSREPAARARELEAELAPVIEIMARTGITAAGIKVTGPGEVRLHHGANMYDRALAHRLTSARARILEEADRTIGIFALPDALLYIPASHYDTPLVNLLGDGEITKFWDSNDRLVPAES